MVTSGPAAAMLRALAERCREAAKTAPDDDTFRKFTELAVDLDAGAAKSERKPGQGNGSV